MVAGLERERERARPDQGCWFFFLWGVGEREMLRFVLGDFRTTAQCSVGSMIIIMEISTVPYLSFNSLRRIQKQHKQQ